MNKNEITANYDESWKEALIRGLYDRGLTKEQIVNLFKIIDKMMSLPKELQQGLVAKIKQLEEERKMPFISPTEELAMERGELKGIQQGIQREQQLIIRQLNRRIGEIESSFTDTIQTLTIEQLELLGEALLDFSTVTDLEQWLENKPES
jgi:predicted transposase YdaD